jgi:aminoglycoside phosphotransferase (APT) family kinase protein
MDGVDLGALTGWMDRNRIDSGPIRDARLLAGGTQNILLRFSRSMSSYVLRRPPLSLRANSNETMRREARVLAALAGSNVPHPRLISACEDEEVLGAVFYLMEPIEGFTATSGLPPLHANDPAIRHRMGLAMVEAIATLGSIDYVAAGLDGFGRPDNYLARQVGRWKAQLASYHDLPGWPGPESIPGVDRVAQWLEANCPKTFFPGIIHGDFHLANVMFKPNCGELAAIVDWELSTIGDPLLDLGWLIATWPEGDQPLATDVAVEPWNGFARADELIDHYASRSDRDLSEIDWYVVLACYKLGIILEGTHARACAGHAPTETGDRLHAHTIDLFKRALRRIG